MSRKSNDILGVANLETLKFSDRIDSEENDQNFFDKYGSTGTNHGLINSEGISWIWGTFILINSLVGVGILNFPYSIHASGGIFISIIIQLIMVILLFLSVTSVIWCSQMSGTFLYQDTVKAYLGQKGQYICSVLILLHCLLISTTYLVAIGQQIRSGTRILFSSLDESPVIFRQLLEVGFTLIVILPFCLVKHIDRLRIASAFASGTVLLVVAVVVYEYYIKDTSKVQVRTRPPRWLNVFLSVPAYSIAYMYDLTSVAVYGRLRERTLRTFIKTSLIALIAIFLFYNIFAGHAYYSFGYDIKPNFMSNYVHGNWVIAVAEISYSLKLCLEYPIYQFIGWTALRTLLTGICGDYYLSDDIDSKSQARFRLMTSLLWIFFTITLMFFVPNINYIIPLDSAAILHFQFTIPGLCILSALKSLEMTFKMKIMRVFAIFIVVFGISVSAILIHQYFDGF